jgi:hypothetical protein
MWNNMFITKSRASVSLTTHHAMNMCGAVDVWVHAFLALALDGGFLSALWSSRFTFVASKGDLDVVAERNLPAPNCKSKSSRSSS